MSQAALFGVGTRRRRNSAAPLRDDRERPWRLALSSLLRLCRCSVRSRTPLGCRTAGRLRSADPRGGAATLVARLGTTISPYSLLRQSPEEVEEETAAGLTRAERRGAIGVPTWRRRTHRSSQWGTAVVERRQLFFIILITALTLNAHGITRTRRRAVMWRPRSDPLPARSRRCWPPWVRLPLAHLAWSLTKSGSMAVIRPGRDLQLAAGHRRRSSGRAPDLLRRHRPVRHRWCRAGFLRRRQSGERALLVRSRERRALALPPGRHSGSWPRDRALHARATQLAAGAGDGCTFTAVAMPSPLPWACSLF